jgi:hypothetical protein
MTGIFCVANGSYPRRKKALKRAGNSPQGKVRAIWRRRHEPQRFRSAHSLQRLNRRGCVGCRRRRLGSRDRGAACLIPRGRLAWILRRSSLDGFRPRAAHAFRGLPAMPRRTAPVESPGARNRRSGRIANDRSGDRANRSEHHGARQRTQCGVARPVLRERSRWRQQQNHSGSGESFGHGVRPSRMRFEAGAALWPDDETSWPGDGASGCIWRRAGRRETAVSAAQTVRIDPAERQEAVVRLDRAPGPPACRRWRWQTSHHDRNRARPR